MNLVFCFKSLNSVVQCVKYLSLLSLDIQAKEYQPPFYDMVSHDPSFEVMKEVVCVQNKRPAFPNEWSSNKVHKLTKYLHFCTSKLG